MKSTPIYKIQFKCFFFQGDDSVVICVSLQNSVDYVVAMGTESAHVYIFQLPSLLPDRPKQVQAFFTSLPSITDYVKGGREGEKTC